DWPVAEALAQTLDGHLVTINDAIEDGWVATNVMLVGDNPWIGLESPVNYQGPYTWVNGEPATYRNFASGEPNGIGSSPWGVNYFPLNDFRGSGWQGKWNDAPQISDAVQSIAEVGEPGVQFWISMPAPDGSGAGCLFANLVDTTGGAHVFSSAAGVVQAGSYQHAAVTYNSASGDAVLYYDGAVVARTNFGTLTLQTSGDFLLGDHYPNPTNYVFSGGLDEMTVYQRNLSASEINAIYQKGSAGKFDAGIASPQNLAEAQIQVNGQTTTTVVGSNTVWQTKIITFTATQNGTPVTISGIEPGMLLDNFVLTQTASNIYYLPEQSLDAFLGENAFGDWTLEIQDARTGAFLTNNTLISWELQIVFANTNATPSAISGGVGQDDQFIPAG
ncbi:MAG TPA: LamG-like jellyroll fold domain-containing protein, partial [Candidatus Baltobacteraceae bacterium]|nr:LamG-like jellyroll fold domain-containing protein [Candidatus Baltobacteraceae bacterium]